MGEVLALTWNDIDFNTNTITVKNNLIKQTKGIHILGTPKTTTSERTVVVSNTLIKILRRHKIYQAENKLRYGINYTNYYIDDTKTIHTNDANYTPVNFVCTWENGNLVKSDSITYCVKCINKKLDITFTFHVLRHYYVKHILKNNLIILLLKQIPPKAI